MLLAFKRSKDDVPSLSRTTRSQLPAQSRLWLLLTSVGNRRMCAKDWIRLLRWPAGARLSRQEPSPPSTSGRGANNQDASPVSFSSLIGGPGPSLPWIWERFRMSILWIRTRVRPSKSTKMLVSNERLRSRAWSRIGLQRWQIKL